MFSDVLVSVFVIHPGIHATSCARCASENDFACGFHWPLSLGTRSSTRRVVAISKSNSESSVLEMLMWDLGSDCRLRPDVIRPAAFSRVSGLGAASRSPARGCREDRARGRD